MTSLNRGEVRLTLTTKMWAEILLLAVKWGWTLDRPVHWLLADGQSVSTFEAQSLATTISEIQKAALHHPFSVYPTPVDMSVLFEVGEFCLGGAFTVEHPPP